MLEFKVKPLSRHPKNFPSAYNKTTHRYASAYIRPTEWEIQIGLDLVVQKAALQAQISAIIIPPFPASLKEERKDLKNKLQKELEATEKLLKDCLEKYSIRFKISKEGGSFSTETPVNQLLVTAKIPNLGKYKVSLIAKDKAGKETIVSQDFTLQDILIVSLGDSYAAGEGNPDIDGDPSEAMEKYANPDIILNKMMRVRDALKDTTPNLRFATWQEPMAHRSYRSGHSKAVASVEGKYQNLHIVTTFLPFARSGGQIEKGLLGPNTDKYHKQLEHKFDGGLKPDVKEVSSIGSLDFKLKIGQIEEAAQTIGNRRIDFLVMTIGGNDIHWSTNFPLLISKNFEPLPFPLPSGEAGRRELESRTQKLLDELPEKYERLNQRIREKLDPRHILITQYPRGFFGAEGPNDTTISSSDCDIFKYQLGEFDMGITKEDAKLVRELARALNDAIREAAAKHHWIIVHSIDHEFSKHGYCAEEPYIVHATESYLSQGDWYGLFHPNEKGCQVYGKRISEKIESVINNELDSFLPV